jgi:hypothetical protein
MITLTFNTANRTVKITDEEKNVLHHFEYVPTVQVRDGYYEVMQTSQNITTEVKIPICRVPISLTLMLITNEI